MLRVHNSFRDPWKCFHFFSNWKENNIIYLGLCLSLYPYGHKMVVALLCLTLSDSMDCSPPGSSVRGILQVRILEWVAIPLSRRSSWPRDHTQVSHIAGRFFIVPSNSDGKESTCNAGDLGLIPRLGKSLGEGKGYPLQYSDLEDCMDRGTWWTTVHGVAKSQTQLSN